MEVFRRGELAARSGCNPETIRFWELKGIIPQPARTAAGHRIYGPIDVERLKFIKKLRTLGLSLPEVTALLSIEEQEENCDEVRLLLSEHITLVERRIKMLQDIKQELERAVSACRDNQQPRCEFVALSG